MYTLWRQKNQSSSYAEPLAMELILSVTCRPQKFKLYDLIFLAKSSSSSSFSSSSSSPVSPLSKKDQSLPSCSRPSVLILRYLTPITIPVFLTSFSTSNSYTHKNKKPKDKVQQGCTRGGKPGRQYAVSFRSATLHPEKQLMRLSPP